MSKTIICGHCGNDVEPNNRYWHRQKAKWYPLYIHNHCGVKLHELGEGNQIWNVHRRGKLNTKAIEDKLAKEATNKAEQLKLSL